MQNYNLKLKIVVLFTVLFLLGSIFSRKEIDLTPVNPVDKIDFDTGENIIKKASSSTEVVKVEPKEVKGDKIENKRYYKVVRVIDGDTIDVSIDGKTQRVRMIGINTPESVDPRKPVECFGIEASEKAKEMLLNNEIELENDLSQDDKDKYGRLLRYVKTKDGLFYNLEIIKQGYAFEYTYLLPYRYQSEFKNAQKYAQANQVGLWANGICGIKNTEAVISTSTDAKCSIKGNINSKKEKIYHTLNCPYYKQTVIDETAGEKWFCTEANAIEAGWRKAENCK